MANKPIIIQFNKGIQFPPRLGTPLILKKTADGKLAYGQNVDSANDEFGIGAVTPGPALTTITDNSQLTGVPFAKAFFGVSSLGVGSLYMIQGLLGAKNVLQRVKNIISGSTPVMDSNCNVTITHSGHSNPVLVDILLRRSNGDDVIYIAGKDDNDTWIYRTTANSGSPSFPGSFNLVATNSNFTGGYTDQFMVLGSDGNIYWIGKDRVSKIDSTDTYSVVALADGLPIGTYGTAAADWQGKLVVAVSTDAFGDFSRRNSAGHSSIVLWDYSSPSFLNSPIPAPCRYISALVVAPNGHLIVFGGVDEGKASIYEFTGFAFNFLYTYVGDLPHSHHSVEFDGQGRILWMTADGQFCRYDIITGVFDHIGSITTSDSAGGLLAKGIGSPVGNEFLISSGSGSTYTLKRVSFGAYVGDGGVGDMVNTPLAVSGLQDVPYNSTIGAITWHLTRPLSLGEKVILQVYENGSLTPTVYSTLEYAVDGPISSKRTVKTLTKINNFSLGVIWKMADNNATAPAVTSAEVEIS